MEISIIDGVIIKVNKATYHPKNDIHPGSAEGYEIEEAELRIESVSMHSGIKVFRMYCPQEILDFYNYEIQKEMLRQRHDLS